ncbi:MAG: DUF1080 domain-containing protein [Fuerstiella sp.]|jgi:hypothetical protein|nr:DUF1080 domain-containing protein [Fuerstiella sp.]MDG2131136.1 DUF1080 domain-containing protein [Fuerstiella sp.]
MPRLTSLIANACLLSVIFVTHCPTSQAADEGATISGTGPGWVTLGKRDFARVNSADDTWSFKDNEIHCTGQPVSVMRSKKQYTNFELVCEWRHLKSAGNSGIFVWTIPESLERLTGPGLPGGIEVQVLDLGYKERYEAGGKRKADWFTCHGDVFPVGASKMTPFPPVAPNGRRSFPSQELSKGIGEWNHYYVRAINGEVRLWVNGTEVSGGTGCSPATGYLCLESEGSPIEFKGLKLRELP